IVIAREPPDHLERGVRYRRQTARKLGKRPRLDLDDEAAQDIVEQPDMALVVAASPLDEELGDPPQRVGAPGRRTVLQHVFEFRDQGSNRSHAGSYRRSRADGVPRTT